MSAPASSRSVVGVHVADVQALLRNITATLPKQQVLREIPFNSIQACQRAMDAGAARGTVVVDYVRSEHGVPKLRVWDTGDGMTATDLHERLGSLSSAARTQSNFGIGAKLALTRVSPHGVVYISLRDGVAHLVRWQYDASTDQWGLALLNPSGSDDLERTVLEVDPDLLPEPIRAAGHGTSVTILGQDAGDDTTWSLRPDGSSSKRWILEVLNDRFTQIPNGIELRVVMANVGKDATGAYSDETRTVAGSAGNLKYYTREHAGSSDPATGARGKIRIGGPVPATAYWWVLPEGIKPPTYMRIGGKVRVVSGGEAYETLGSKYMSTAGVWANANRVEIHFVPDEEVGAQPDLQRTTLTVDGLALPVLEWCEEFKRSMPAAIKNLLAGASRTQASKDFTAQLSELCNRLAAAPVARRRGKKVTVTMSATGELAVAARPTRASGTTTGRPRGLRGALAGLCKARSSHQQVEPSLGAVLAVDGDRAASARTVAPAQVVLPDVRWVNTSEADLEPELDGFAARYIAPENLLVINAQGPTYRKLLASWTHMYRDQIGSQWKVEAQVRDYFGLALQDAVVGLKRDYPSTWPELVTPAALTVRAAGVYHVDCRLRQVFGKAWKAGTLDEELLAEVTA